MGKLNLDKLKEGVPFISEIMGAFMMEAAIYCLIQQGHTSGVQLTVHGDFNQKFVITWSVTLDETALKSWNDWKEATEYGAMALAVLVMMKLTEYRNFERTQQKAGIDFWLLQEKRHKKARLEVSGIWKESSSNTINMRIQSKGKNIKPANLPAYIVVVEFGMPQAKIIVK